MSKLSMISLWTWIRWRLAFTYMSTPPPSRFCLSQLKGVYPGNWYSAKKSLLVVFNHVSVTPITWYSSVAARASRSVNLFLKLRALKKQAFIQLPWAVILVSWLPMLSPLLSSARRFLTCKGILGHLIIFRDEPHRLNLSGGRRAGTG